MDPTVPYFACVVGAAAVYGLLLPQKPGVKSLGAKALCALVGLGVFAWMLVEAARYVAPVEPGESAWPEAMFAIFSVIAVASAVRMITHARPIYSALYFIMVVLSSAALFLLLQAEFMAFALIIVYAGAILITYMFVIMLAQQAPVGDEPAGEAEYDRNPREPMAAVVVGFIMLALFTHMVFDGVKDLPAQPSADQVSARMSQQMSLMPLGKDAAAQEPSNVQLVGLDLVHKFPVSLELAGIILLMAMFGAVVLARKQIELGEDEIREAAGMRRLAFHSDDPFEHSVPPSGGGGGS